MMHISRIRDFVQWNPRKTPLRKLVFGQKSIMMPIKVASLPSVEWSLTKGWWKIGENPFLNGRGYADDAHGRFDLS